jgi:hypothetical protein
MNLIIYLRYKIRFMNLHDLHKYILWSLSISFSSMIPLVILRFPALPSTLITLSVKHLS